MWRSSCAHISSIGPHSELPSTMLVVTDVDGWSTAKTLSAEKQEQRQTSRVITVFLVLFNRRILAWNHDDWTTVAASDENSAQPDIRQPWIDIEYAGGERIQSNATPSQMAACPELWICPQRDEYRLQAWYDVVKAIVQPSRLSLLAEGWTTTTEESTAVCAEAPSAMTQAKSPLTLVRTSTVDDLGGISSTLPVEHKIVGPDAQMHFRRRLDLDGLYNVTYNPPARYPIEELELVLRFDDHSPAAAALKSVALQSPTVIKGIGIWRRATEPPTLSFSLTMHENTGGGAACARSEVQSVLLGDISPLSLTITIVDLTRRYPPARYFHEAVGATVLFEYDGSDGVVTDAWDGSLQDRAKFDLGQAQSNKSKKKSFSSLVDAKPVSVSTIRHPDHRHFPKLLLRLLRSPNHPDIYRTRGSKVVLLNMVSGNFEGILHPVILDVQLSVTGVL
ncbi:hypothetical protein EV421DRAFT_1985768 [Armillaria borealis]|uniref:Uncharacterized protein n=1 Tax=Armillaria borealis TaxID=47425 RepID=A0AA39J420_9AGAR|nr:hypothetical protein EV421DRAFT_1985768 [Armillaria borealis]